MTGDNAARRADDIGGQELSYAEVKAIASGNPAVLTLAEADAELGRLAILRKNHADEQFLARRALRELPEKIERLEGRIASLTADREKARVHETDPVVIGSRPCPKDDLMERLGHALEALPKQVRQLTRVPLGRIRGLAFGVTLRADSTADAYLEGSVVRHAALSREHRGPRAILNALERLIGTYGSQIEEAKQDLAIAQGQLRDHQARLGKTFPHQDYLTELTLLRDALKSALAQPAGSADQPEIPVADLAERIKSLKSAHGVEATPDRNAARRTVSGEEPVTRRIRKQREEQVVEPENPGVEMTPVEQSCPVKDDEPLQMVCEPERKSLDDGRFVVEPAEPVLEFRRVVERCKMGTKGNSRRS